MPHPHQEPSLTGRQPTAILKFYRPPLHRSPLFPLLVLLQSWLRKGCITLPGILSAYVYIELASETISLEAAGC